MNNKLVEGLLETTNFEETENGALAHKSTLSALYDMFAFGGAYRMREDNDCILLFKNAFEENPELALKCLFYLRDIRGGQGERRFFRVCFHWLAKEYPQVAIANISNIAEYGRYDDLYCLVGTPAELAMFDFMEKQLQADITSLANSENTGVSLLAKWIKSENASSVETKELGNKTREHLGMSHKEYRKMLAALRTRINIVEKLMSENRWEEIEFDKLPSKAGLQYSNTFAHKDIIEDKYAEFMANKANKVNAKSLFPYEIVKKVTDKMSYYGINMTETERATLQKYWDNQNDYLEGKKCKMMCVVDTSGSMTRSSGSVRPIDVAISLGMYCAERIGEPFKNYFISFASRPQFIKVEGVDFVDKVQRIYKQNLCDNTDLSAVFELLRSTILGHDIVKSDIPETIVVISDMEIDRGSYWRSEQETLTEMEKIREQWALSGLRLPKLVYWNVNARNNRILDLGWNVSYVSGCSPIIFKSVMTGKTGEQLMLEVLQAERYNKVVYINK